MARRRVPIMISVPVLVAAFSAGIVASLWLDEDEPEPARISVSSGNTVLVAFPAPTVPAEPTAQSRLPEPSVPAVPPAWQAETPQQPVSSARQPAPAGVDADAEPAGTNSSPAPVSLVRSEVAADLPARQQPEAEEPPAPVEAKPAEPIAVARLEPETVTTVVLPALTLPAGLPSELRAPAVQSTPRRYYRAVKKQVRKMVDVPILGPLFGLKYYP